MIMSLLHVLQVTSPVYKFYHFHSLLYIFAAALVVSTAELGGVVALSLSLSLSLFHAGVVMSCSLTAEEPIGLVSFSRKHI